METHENPRAGLRNSPSEGVVGAKGLPERATETGRLRFLPCSPLQSKPYRLILVQSLRLACLIRS